MKMGVLPGRRPADASDADGDARDGDWLDAFYRGERTAIETCYLRHFDAVERAIGQRLGGADRETVIHEVFTRLVAREDLRRTFRGGSLAAWLGAIARNQAIDYGRRLSREVPWSQDEPACVGQAQLWEDGAEASLLIEKFRRTELPAEWVGVFETRFLRELTQREAAAELGISRTTVVLRELRIRQRLRRFLCDGRDDEANHQQGREDEA
jgi:RNA polymerase sigma-70 factor (ECF subfamily)